MSTDLKDWTKVVNEAKRKTPAGPCSFCGKTLREVKGLIAGPESLYICNECVGQCVEILGAAGHL